MTDLSPYTWLPNPLRTERLTLRKSEPRDRPRFVDLFASPEVNAYDEDFPRYRGELESELPKVVCQQPGAFVVDLDGTMIGIVTILDRRPANRPGHVRPEADEPELTCLLLPHAWGHGYGFEACTAVLAWLTATFPGEPVVLCAPVAHERSRRLAAKLGFTEVERFEEDGWEQWFGVRPG